MGSEAKNRVERVFFCELLVGLFGDVWVIFGDFDDFWRCLVIFEGFFDDLSVVFDVF